MKPAQTTARVLAAGLSLLPLCSCMMWRDTSPSGPAAELPGELTMNKDAGRGVLLMVNVRLESGEELPFALDTGSPLTMLPKAFEPKLGKRIDTMRFFNFGREARVGRYATPKLYLGATRLATGTDAVTYDYQKWWPDATNTLYSRLGILGMDTLKHYCIQLDFAAGKMRFLGPEQVNPAVLGKAYPLKFTRQGCPWIEHGSLIGEKGARLEIDTGDYTDGGMQHGLLRQQLWRQKGARMGTDYAFFPECTWDGRTYKSLCIGAMPTYVYSANIMGLRFLARHLVTFDFPRRTMYLKRTSSYPFPSADLQAALDFMKDLTAKGRLPGWSKGDHGSMASPFYPPANLVTFTLLKEGDSSTYHYTVGRQTEDSPWKLQRAWRTDQKGRTIQEYSLP